MLTIFTIPKAFAGLEGVIQHNAIQSWTRLHPEVEVILCGDDPGVAEVARDLGVQHLPDIARNEYGTPLLRSAFTEVLAQAHHDLLCYVNADIILISDFTRALCAVSMGTYLLIGQRWNIDITERLAFDSATWEVQLRQRVKEEAELNVAEGMDYFVFSKQVLSRLLEDMPEFAVGRPWWDTWMVYHTRRIGLPVIDATPAVQAVHQNHGYAHVPERRMNKWHGPEGDENMRIAIDEHIGSLPHFGVKDATHVLRAGAAVPALGDKYLFKRIKRLEVLRSDGGDPGAGKTLARALRVGFRLRRMLPGLWWRHLLYRITR